MRKKVFGRKFSRDYGSRQALLRALTRSLVLKGSINTTKAKAKAVQPDVDFLVNLVKKNSVSENRQAYAMLGNDRETLNALTKTVAPLFANRTSGFTKIVPLPRRSGDNAEMSRLEWVEKVAEGDKTGDKKEATSNKKVKPETKEKKSTLTERVRTLGKKKKENTK